MDLLKFTQSFAQECIGKLPLIVLGSGASVPYGLPGMGSLGEHLAASQLPPGMTDKDISGWTEFCATLPQTDLESALTEVSLTEAVTQHIVSTTWKFLSAADVRVFEQVVANRQSLPLTRLYQHLFQSTAQDIQVVTPNYDRIAEYAAEAGGYCAYTGFSFGLLGHRAQNYVPKIFSGGKQIRTVNVWKVHGSFSWFRDQHGVVVSLPPMAAPPAGMEPVIVTPGIDKYRRTHGEPFRTLMQNADAAIRTAAAFLCVGYGFNDEHLQPLLVERCDSDSAPLVLMTKEISEKAHEFFKSGKCRKYLALEESLAGTRVFSNDIPDGQEIQGRSFWQLPEFLSLIM